MGMHANDATRRWGWRVIDRCGGGRAAVPANHFISALPFAMALLCMARYRRRMSPSVSRRSQVGWAPPPAKHGKSPVLRESNPPAPPPLRPPHSAPGPVPTARAGDNSQFGAFCCFRAFAVTGVGSSGGSSYTSKPSGSPDRSRSGWTVGTLESTADQPPLPPPQSQEPRRGQGLGPRLEKLREGGLIGNKVPSVECLNGVLNLYVQAGGKFPIRHPLP